MSEQDSLLRDVLPRRLERSIAAVKPASEADPRTTVASLALDGCLLGTYAHIYPSGETWWMDALSSIASYADVPLPRPRLGSASRRWDTFPLRDELPLLDAVLRLVQAGGIAAVTLPRVARVADRDLDWLQSAFGSVDELIDDLIARVLSDGFDDLAPLHLEPSPEAVRSMLDVLTDSRRTASLLRVLALSGIEVASGPVMAAARLSPVAQPDHARLSDSEWVAALAIDAWALGSTARHSDWPEALDRGVVSELHCLIRS